MIAIYYFFSIEFLSVEISFFEYSPLQRGIIKTDDKNERKKYGKIKSI